jgi:hypothetical protein
MGLARTVVRTRWPVVCSVPKNISALSIYLSVHGTACAARGADGGGPRKRTRDYSYPLTQGRGRGIADMTALYDVARALQVFDLICSFCVRPPYSVPLWRVDAPTAERLILPLDRPKPSPTRVGGM